MLHQIPCHYLSSILIHYDAIWFEIQKDQTVWHFYKECVRGRGGNAGPFLLGVYPELRQHGAGMPGEHCPTYRAQSGMLCNRHVQQCIYWYNVSATMYQYLFMFLKGEFSSRYCTSMFVKCSRHLLIRSGIYCNACVDIHMTYKYIRFLWTVFFTTLSYTVQTLIWASEKNIDAFTFDKTQLANLF